MSSMRGLGTLSSRVRRPAVFVSVLAVVATYSVVALGGAASAASIVGSNFEIDEPNANLAVNGSAPAIDWLAGGSGSAMRSGVLVRDDLPTGQDDDAFTQGTDINDTTPTITTGGIPNNKSDLTHFGVFTELNAGASLVNVFWTRVQAPSGTTTMDFEFNQSTMGSNGISPPHVALPTTLIPVRTPGDVLISYLLEQGGTHPTLTRRLWTGTAWGAPYTFSATEALGAINTTLIPATETGGLGAVDPYTFGEASIKLEAFAGGSNSCTTFSSVYLRSRSSATDTDENKDFIAPETVPISTCGTVRVHKTDTNGPLAGAVFTLYKDVAPIGGSKGAGDTEAAGTCGPTDAQGDCSIADVAKGDYWLVETTVPAGHDPVDPQHISITQGDQVVSLNLDDPIQQGTIRVTKVAAPPDGTDFNFTLDGSAFTLDDDADSTLPSTRDFTVPVGAHSLSEVDIPNGWALTGLRCVDPTRDTTTSLAEAGASVNVAKDEVVACTFTNTYAPRQPGLDTQVSSAGGGAWNDTATLTGDGTHAVTGTVTFYACAPTAVPTACAAGTQVGVPVTVSGSQVVTTESYTAPSAGWTCFRAVYTSTSPYYSDTSHSNDTTECFLTRNANLTVSKTAIASFGRSYEWTIEKNVNRSRAQTAPGEAASFRYTVDVAHSHTDDGWTVAGEITVTNPNAVPFAGVDVTDAIDNGAGRCAVSGGIDAVVPAAGTLVLPYTCTYTVAPSSAQGTNTATAAWDGGAYFTTNSSAQGSAVVDFSDTTPTTSGELVTVTDSMAGVLGTVNALQDPSPTTFEYTIELVGVPGTCTDYDNTARIVETGQSDSRGVTVCVGTDLGVDVAAAGTVDRTYGWLIDKAVDRTTITGANRSDGTFTYTVTVTPDGFTDGNHQLSGTITATNPNDWQDVVADLTVTSNLGGGVLCSVTDGDGVTVPQGGSVDRDFLCVFTGVPALAGTITASVSWDAEEAFTDAADASADGEVALQFANEVNKVVTVFDDKTDPAHPAVLGSATWGEAPTSFTYALTKSGRDATETLSPACEDYTNVAEIAETGQSDSQVVTLCHTFSGGGGGEPTPSPTPAPTPVPGPSLPVTGDAIGLLARSALAMIAGGLILLAVNRKRRLA